MAWQPQCYPEGFSHTRREALARANGRCELCCVKQGTRRRNVLTDKPYYVYLSVCHRVFYETWKQDADTIVLCQRCHNRFDKLFRRRYKQSQQTPIGYAKMYISDNGKSVLYAECRTYTDLLVYIDSLLPGREFEIHLEINLSIVGNGFYERTETGTRKIHEYGACEGLQLAFAVIPKKLKPANLV